MMQGSHILLFSTDVDADRDFFRDVLKFKNVDTGGGWLIFKLPPSEIALHPGSARKKKGHLNETLMNCEFYFICKDLAKVMKKLKAAKVKCSPARNEGWGIRTTVQLPSGGKIGLYQPMHKSAYKL